MKTVVAIAFSGRDREGILWANCFLLLKNPDLQIVLIGSSFSDNIFGQSMEAIFGERLIYKNYPNQPLGAKWNFAVQIAKTLNPDFLVINGSDDLLSFDFFDDLYLKEFIDSNAVMGGCRNWLILNGGIRLRDYRALYASRYTHSDLPTLTIGAGRIYKSSFLDKHDWIIFDSSQSIRLDDMGHTKASEHGIHIFDRNDLVMSIKGPWSALNPLDKILNAKTVTSEIIDYFDQEDIINRNFRCNTRQLINLFLWRSDLNSLSKANY